MARRQAQGAYGEAGGTRAKLRLSERSTAVIRGEEDVTAWDWEELKRGRKRSVNGNFPGPDPIIIPRQCFDEMYRRVIETAQTKLLEALPEIVDALVRICGADSVDDATKLRAITYAMDRVLGKPTDRVEVEAEVRRKPWENAMIEAIVGDLDEDVVDAEVVEGEETHPPG